MEERRSNGFRVKPSFGQVLGFIQESEPLTLDLPNRKASIYTSSHFYLDDYPNAPEPVSETPLPHTSLNPAAAFETADEGYSGTPFPRPPREFTRPSFLPDSDDGGMDPGQALRNDGLNPPRPPTLGGRMRESGRQGGGGAAAAVRSVSENQTMLALRGGGDWLDRTLRIPRRPPGLAPPPDEVPPPQIIGRPSEVEPLLERAGQRAAEVERQAAQDIERFASQQIAEAEATEGFASAAEVAGGSGDGGGRGNGRSSGRPGRRRPGGGRRCGRSDRGTGGRRCRSGRRRHCLGHGGRSQRGLAPAGLGRRDGRRHGQRRLAALSRHRRADFERNAGKRGHRPLLRAGAAAPPTAASLQDRHDGVRGRAPGPTPATNPSAPREAPQSAAHALRHQSGPHPRVLG